MAETNVPTYGSAKEYLEEQKKRRQLAGRKEFASTLRGMYAQGQITPSTNLFLEAGPNANPALQDVQDRAQQLGLGEDDVQKFINTKLQKSPIMELRERNAATRASRAAVIKKERAKQSSSIAPMEKSIVTTSLRDEFGNPYRRSLDTPGAQARRRDRERRNKGDTGGQDDPDIDKDKGIATQGDVGQREVDKKADVDLAKEEENVARKELRDVRRRARQAKRAEKQQRKNKSDD